MAERVRVVAQAILDRLAPGWDILEVGSPGTEVSVVVGGHGPPVTAYFMTHLPEASAVAELASQLQDHVIEETWGEARPPCPGHPHPLSARVVDGVAVWECPRAPEHHREPILR
jgi:hypothetical protein